MLTLLLLYKRAEEKIAYFASHRRLSVFIALELQLSMMIIITIREKFQSTVRNLETHPSAARAASWFIQIFETKFSFRHPNILL